MELEIFSKTKIYIMAPYQDKGGGRSLHQLAKVLVDMGYRAFVYYYDRMNVDKPCCERDSIQICHNIEDDYGNILIVPESHAEYLINYERIRKVIWWLSLHYYRSHNDVWKTKAILERHGIDKRLYPVLLPFVFAKNYKSYLQKEYRYIDSTLGDYYHFYNCFYVKEYLESKGISEGAMMYLCGPVTEEFCNYNKESIMSKKENIVAINPSKIEKDVLYRFKKCISKLDTPIRLVEIKNMTPNEVKNVLEATKVYVDLGYFPGPERMPREAVLMYCNVFTSVIGAAGNEYDVSIDYKYKSDIKLGHMMSIAKKIEDMILNYETQVQDFELYRENVKKQIVCFDRNIMQVLKNIPKEP